MLRNVNTSEKKDNKPMVCSSSTFNDYFSYETKRVRSEGTFLELTDSYIYAPDCAAMATRNPTNGHHYYFVQKKTWILGLVVLLVFFHLAEGLEPLTDAGVQAAVNDWIAGETCHAVWSIGANQKQTDLIRSDAPAAAVKSALELLPNIGRVSVTRLVDTDGFTWKITFNGCKTVGLESEKNICNYGNIRQLVGDVSGLLGGNPSPSVVVDTILNGTQGTSQNVSDLTSGPPHYYDIERLHTGQRYYVRVSARNQCPYVCPGCCAFGSRQVPPNLFAIPTDQTPGTPAPPILIRSTDKSPIVISCS